MPIIVIGGGMGGTIGHFLFTRQWPAAVAVVAFLLLLAALIDTRFKLDELRHAANRCELLHKDGLAPAPIPVAASPDPVLAITGETTT